MQLALIVAVLVTLSLAENGSSAPVDGTTWRLSAALAAMTLVVFSAAALSAHVAAQLQRGGDRAGRWLRRFDRLKIVHTALWLAMAAVVLVGLDWVRLVRGNLHLDRAILVDELLILAPLLVPLLLSWTAFYDVERAAAARDGQAITSRGRYVLLHARHYLGLLLVPLLAIVAAVDAAELVVPGVSQGPYAAVVLLPPLALLVILFPLLLRCVWQTAPLPDGPLRERLEAAARRCGLKVRNILVWKTDRLANNAAVAGFFSPLRYVFLTDGLLATLTDEQVEAVLAHEAGHIRYHHLPLRIIAVLAPLGLWFVFSGWPVTAPAPSAAADVRINAAALLPQTFLLPALLALYVGTVLSWYCRLLEHQADLWACGVIAPPGGACHRSVTTLRYITTLETLAVLSGGDRERGGWLHPSVARRTAFLMRLAEDPAGRARFHRRLAWTGCLLVGTMVLTLGYLLLGG